MTKNSKTEIKKNKILINTQRNCHFPIYAKKDIEKGKRYLKSSFKPGDPVLVFRKILGDKFSAHWADGFKVLHQSGPESFIITNGKSKLRANKTHLKYDTSILEEGCRNNKILQNS